MASKKSPIGLIDAGVGGLTVAKELAALLPSENLIYCADSANCPYGNRTKDEIIYLTGCMLDFLEKQQVKLALMACNSISALKEHFQGKYSYPILDVITPATTAVSTMDIDAVGLVATKFTVESGVYEAQIKALKPGLTVYSHGSKDLAKLIDSGDLTGTEIKEEVKRIVQDLGSYPIRHIILGCTHYPIVSDVFNKVADELSVSLSIINPAVYQAAQASEILQSGSLLNETETTGTRFIFTTGEKDICAHVLRHLGFSEFTIEQLDKF